MMQKLIALTAGTVLAVSVRIFILTHQAPAPDFGHLGELADADSQAVSLAQKGFASAKLALFAQVMALDCIVVATAIAAWLETKRLPKGKVHLSRWLKFALWTGYMIALLAISFYILILGLLREVVFAESSSRYTGTFWALEFSAAYFAGLQFATYGNNTLQSGKPDMQYLMSLLEASQQLMNETKALLDAAESSQESADKPETDVHEANVKVVV